MRRGPVWSPKGMAIRSGAGNSLSRHSQNETTTCGLLSLHRVFPLLPQTYQVHLLTFCFNPHTHERCDISRIVSCIMPSCFNPRTREGCDEPSARVLYQLKVSIHAPARGATTPLQRTIFPAWFQSTHPRGVRPASRPFDL